MSKSRFATFFAAALCLLAPAAFADNNDAGNSGPVYLAADIFTNLPDGVRFPEGIAANPATGDIFVGTFDFGPNSNKLLRIDRHGNTTAQRDFGGTPLLGLGLRD